MLHRRTLALAAFIFLFSNLALAQANQYKTNPPKPPPSDEDVERVLTEEIKLNVSARNDFGHFDPTLILDDLMVVEDRQPHPIASLRRVPASVLIVVDTGGEMQLAKSLRTTRQTALNLVGALSNDNSIALMQYADKAEILVEWTADKTQIMGAIASRTNFGRRSQFIEAMNLAAKFMEKRPAENRHLVLITDGTDSNDSRTEREAALKRLVAANVSVHVLSYTAMEQGELKEGGGIFKKGEGRAPKRTDETHKATLPQPIQDMMNMPRIGSINTDAAMIRARRQRRDALKQSQEQLTTLAKETGGEMILPTSLEEMTVKAKEVAGLIDSNYVITYIPKRPLSNSPTGSAREIEVISRRVGLVVQARRKFVIPEKK